MFQSEIEKLQQEINQMERNKFSYFCNDQFDIVDELNQQIAEKQKVLNELESSII